MDTADSRIEDIVDWLTKHKPVLVYSDKVEVTISISGSSIKGKVTNFPDIDEQKKKQYNTDT